MRGPHGFDIRDRGPVLIAILLVWLAGNLAFAFLLNLPRAEVASSLREESRTIEERLLGRRQKVQAFRTEYERVMGGQRTLRTFYEEVLSTKRQRMTPVQKEVRSIASRFNITADSISYARDILERDQIVKFSAVMPLNGSYENLRAFINAVENSENFLIVEAVTLADSKEGGVILSLSIAMSTYFFDPDVRAKPGQEGGAAS